MRLGAFALGGVILMGVFVLVAILLFEERARAVVGDQKHQLDQHFPCFGVNAAQRGEEGE